MITRSLLTLLALFLMSQVSVFADWTATVSIGEAWNAPHKLTIEPDNNADYDTIVIDKPLQTRGLQRPP